MEYKSAIIVEKVGRIAVWRMNIPDKLNCLNVAMLKRMGECFDGATKDESIDAVVLTGTGRYFSSGAAFGDVGLKPTLRLSTFHAAVASLNVGIFDPFIHFPKPIFIASNGPAVGGATTMQLLCDAVLCVPTATFHTPFKQLGITPEGCSNITFERKMGKEGARRMLKDGEKIDAAEAKKLGFVDKIVDESEDLIATAVKYAEDWVAQGRGRTIIEEGLVGDLDKMNHIEGQQLADAMFSVTFLKKNGLPSLVAYPLSPMLRLVAKI